MPLAILPGVDMTALCGPFIVAETDGDRFGYALRGTAVLPCRIYYEKNKMKTNIKIDFIYRWPNVRQIRHA